MLDYGAIFFSGDNVDFNYIKDMKYFIILQGANGILEYISFRLVIYQPIHFF